MLRRSVPRVLPLVLALLAGAAPVALAAPGARDSATADSAGVAPRDSLPLRFVPVQALGDSAGGRAALAEPSGVTCDAFGRIYVADAAQNRLVRYDAAGAWLGEAGALGSGAGDLRRPTDAVAVGSLGVAILDRENQRIVLYDLFGRLQGVLTDLAALAEDVGRIDPLALAADRGGALYVADADGDRLLALDFRGQYTRTLGGYGAGGGSFRGLSGVAAGRDGEVVTAERAGRRVQRLEPGGHMLASWPLPAGPRRGRLPVAVDDSARVAVADESTGRLWLFDAAGRALAERDGLAGPRALAFAPDGSLLAAESGARRVRRFVLVPAGTPAPPGR